MNQSFVARLVCFMLGLCVALSLTTALAAKQPNIVWITAEDMSPTLGCYGDKYSHSPHIDKLAAESVRYTHAFASAPVCSPSRSCLITGCYAPSLGTQQMRSAYAIPQQMQGFPQLLRKAGYYTTNNVKTDYNTANWQQIIDASWDESSGDAHWRKRSHDRQPFFSVFNFMESHQSRTMVWPYERFQEEIQSRLTADEIHDPQHAPIPPYYPNTPVVRKTVARFYDCVTAMDKRVGEVLDQLKADKLLDDTIVFFYSDHGSGMPRHKRALLDSGMHVPLLVRFPAKYAHLAPAEAGATSDRLVSFVDFGPTVLSLADITVPDAMQGVPFLGQQTGKPREYIFGHRDRVDEVRDLSRSVRDKRFLFIRNYMPHLGYNQPTAWPDQGEIRHEFYRVDAEQANRALQHFVSGHRPPVELYDCEQDPLNLNNLAHDPAHRKTLKRLLQQHHKHQLTSGDLGFIAESDAVQLFAKQNGWESARQRDLALAAGYKAASQVGSEDASSALQRLRSKNSTVRYWAVLALAQLKSATAEITASLQACLTDESAAVQIEAATILVNQGGNAEGLRCLQERLADEELIVVLHAARNVQLLGNKAATLRPAMQDALQRARAVRPPDTPATVVQPGDQDLAMFIGFAVEAFLAKTAEERSAWKSLFDGEDLSHWRPSVAGQQVNAVNGEIQLLAKGKNLWLLHDGNFSDFELEVEAKMPQVYNSGIGFRCQSSGGKPKGYQCEIDDRKSGMIYAIGKGWVWPKGAEQTKRFHEMAGESFRRGEWNKFRIVCRGEHIQIWVNGTKTADLRDKLFKVGSIALQHHGKGDTHFFRNIRIRELTTE